MPRKQPAMQRRREMPLVVGANGISTGTAQNAALEISVTTTSLCASNFLALNNFV